MAGMSFEEFAGGASLEDRLRIDPAEQARRDEVANRLRRGEETGDYGNFLKTSQVVEGSTASASAAPKAMSFEEFAGLGTPAESKTSDPFYSSKSQLAWEVVLPRLKSMGGEAAAIADLALGFFGPMQFSLGRQLGTTLGAFGAGAPGAVRTDAQLGRRPGDPVGINTIPGGAATGRVPKYRPGRSEVKADQFGEYTAFTAGREAAVHFSPFYDLLQSIGSGEVYEQANTTRGMTALMDKVEQAGRTIEQATGGRISRDAIPMFVETLMVGAPGLGARAKPAIQPHIQKALRDSAQKLRTEAEADIAAQPTPAERAARAPVQQQINELLGIRTPAEQAKITRQRRKDAQEAFGKDKLAAEGSDYVDIGESIFRAEERLANEARYREAEAGAADRAGGEAYQLPTEAQRAARPERIGQAEILRIMQKPGFERTAEDLMVLREARKQGGKASPEALMLLSAAGLGAAAGAAADEEDMLRGAFLGGSGAALLASPMFMRRGRGKAGETPREPLKVSGGEPLTAELAEMLKKPLYERSPEEVEALRKWSQTWVEWAKKDEGKAHPEALALLASAGVGGLIGYEMGDAPGAVAGAATGMAALTPFLGRGRMPDSGIRRSEMGAVKGPGGMWHPEATERLADALGGDRVERQYVRQGRREELGNNPDAVIAFHSWTDRAVKNYLNRYAGTEKDPLKDVEIPFGEGTRRWEEITDELIRSKPARNFRNSAYAEDTGLLRVAQEHPNEPIFDIPKGHSNYNQAYQALQSYLSHVGDYLRQNVDPAKLQQYDLPRAVRETAANDARVAKEMEKAAAASMKDLPVYKDYGDGFKWVELKLPEKLTEEQARGVRKENLGPALKEVTPGTWRLEIRDSLGKIIEVKEVKAASRAAAEERLGVLYTAIDPDGKPIRNSYTDSLAQGASPEEAFLAGQLAREGNQMGHCVGGYCEGVAAGESRIFSLRDSKGRSHVTVESKPGPVNMGDLLKEMTNAEQQAWHKQMQQEGWQAGPDGVFRRKHPEGGWVSASNAEKVTAAETAIPRIAEFIAQIPDEILQIKGKQNRAPNAEYLPYVQDFVKSGKWGEVGDLENTGLMRGRDVTGWTGPTGHTRLTMEQLGLDPDGFYTSAEIGDIGRKLSVGGDPVSFDQLPAGREPGPRNQQGSIDPQLLAGLGTIGLGGLVGSIWSDDPISGAVLGALAGAAVNLPAARRAFKTTLEGADKLAGATSTRLKNLSEPLWKRVALDYESGVLRETHSKLDRVLDWMKTSTNLPRAAKEKLDNALFFRGEGAGQAIAEANKGNPALVKSWREVQNVLRELGEKAQQLGRFRDLSSDYFPQRVKDFEGLKAKLDQPIRQGIERALHEAEQTMLRVAKRGLADSERDAIINRMLRNHFTQKTFQPGYAKPRTIEQVTQELRPFYHSPQESLAITIMELVKDIEMAKMFGKDLVQGEKGGRKYINVDMSIGNLLGRELAEGRLDHAQMREAEKLLKSRFGPGEQSPTGIVQNVRNLSYASLLADLPSAAVQLGDPLMAVYGQGLRSTMTAVARLASGRNKISVRDFGLADHIAEEIAFGQSAVGGRMVRSKTAVGAAAGAVAGVVMSDDLGGAIPGAAAGAFMGYANAVGTAAALNKVLRQGVFKPIDMFGKNVHLNAALDRGQRMASSAGGIKQLRAKYGDAYGPEFDQLVRDLRGAQLTSLTRSYLFSELARFQPISRSEVPQMYLNHPNGRLAYQLKTFMLKQADVVRRDAYNEIKKGNVAKGLRNLTEFSLVLGLGGATAEMLKDWMMGRPVDFETTDIAENVLKTFGWAKYVRDKAETNPVVAPLGALVPAPVGIMDRVLAQDPRAVRYIPVVGELYYEWELGGQEEAEIRRAREAKRAGREIDLSPRAEAYRERKRELRRERREREGR